MDRLLSTVTQGSERGALLGASSTFVAAFSLLALALSIQTCSRGHAPTRLTHTFDSPTQLATAVADALQQRNAERLQALALTEDEFRVHVWPRLPASRSEGGVPFGFVWAQLHSKSRAYLAAVLEEYGGAKLDVVHVRFRGETTDYGAFVVNRDAEVVVRDQDGQKRTVRLFGSMLEQGGRYKLFSYVVE
jgi:hypothetical protein